MHPQRDGNGLSGLVPWAKVARQLVIERRRRVIALGRQQVKLLVPKRQILPSGHLRIAVVDLLTHRALRLQRARGSELELVAEQESKQESEQESVRRSGGSLTSREDHRRHRLATAPVLPQEFYPSSFF